MSVGKFLGNIVWAAAITVVVLAVAFTAYYRYYFKIWPGQGPGAQIRSCGRFYEIDNSAPDTLEQARWASPGGLTAIGKYPPLGPSEQLLADPMAVCPAIIFLKTGPDSYQRYDLSGGSLCDQFATRYSPLLSRCCNWVIRSSWRHGAPALALALALARP